jgi:hypothetical protein
MARQVRGGDGVQRFSDEWLFQSRLRAREPEFKWPLSRNAVTELHIIRLSPHLIPSRG